MKTHHKKQHTRKRLHRGGRGGMGGAELGHAYTTGASQELYQMSGRTPGLSSGGNRRTRRNHRNHRNRRN